MKTSCLIRHDVPSQSAYEENSYLVGRIKDLENLIEEMVSSNQEVIDETANTTEDYKIRVSKAFNTKRLFQISNANIIRLRAWSNR